MMNEKLLEAIGNIEDEFVYDAKMFSIKKYRRQMRSIAAAACAVIVFFGGFMLERYEYIPWGAGCGASTGVIVDGVQYYYVDHRGVWSYTPEGGTKKELGEFWMESWDVNDYGIYYKQNNSLYVRDHATKQRHKLYTAKRTECTHIGFELTEDGNVILILYDKKAETKGELLLDGKTGEVIAVLSENVPYGNELTYSESHFTSGERQFVLEPVEDSEYQYYLLENGENLLPEGTYTSQWSQLYVGDVLWIQYDEIDAPDGKLDTWLILWPDGRNQIITLGEGFDYSASGTETYVFCTNDDEEIVCTELATGEFWIVEKGADIEVYENETDGEYLYSAVPWKQNICCWEIIYKDGKPAWIKLMSDDIFSER